jgi:DNA helicase II / ATP-dependent DNA helicase PcrA
MTRARQHLHLLVPQRFYVTQQTKRGDKHLYGSLTRFIPPELVDKFDNSNEQQGESALLVLRPDLRVDIASRIRSAWG